MSLLDYRDELIAMDAEDQRVRAELAADGSLFDGYHPRMEAVHIANAVKLRTIMASIGWPSHPLVGTDGASAAWRVAQHAIGEPDFMRECHRLQRAAAERGDIPAWQPATLGDRILMYEGRPQIYGTQLEPGDDGLMRPYVIDDPDHVDDRRASVGLGPLAQLMAQMEPWPKPFNRAKFDAGYQVWLRKAGWRK